MSIARTQKEENARLLREELNAIPHAILVDFRGLDVAGATELRRKLRDGDARFRVVKNSTMLRAVEDMPLAELSDAFVGQTAVAYTEGDVVTLAKVLSEFAKDFETPSFKAGVVDGAPISAEEFEQLAKLPPRDELIAKALYLMNYPVTGFVTALSGILRGFVVVLEQIRAQKEEAGETEPVAAEAAPEAEKAAPAEAADEGAEAAASAEDAGDEASEEPAEAAAAEAPAAASADEAPEEQAEAADQGADETEQAAADEESAEAAPEGDGEEAAPEEASAASEDEAEGGEDAAEEAASDEDTAEEKES